MGNLTRDPEIKTIGSGSTLANLSMAVNRRYTVGNGEKREEVTYIDIAFWGKQAEVFGKLSVRKGTQLLVEGRLQLDTWEDKQTGQKRSKLRVVGENFQLVGGRREGPDGQGGGPTAPTRERANHADVDKPHDGGGKQENDSYYQGSYSDEPF